MNGNSRVEELLESILIWTRVGMYSNVLGILKAHFEESRPEERLAYELLTGERSQKEIIELCKQSVPKARISPATLSTWISKWERVGLLKKEGNSVTKHFSLGDFGIEVPAVSLPVANPKSSQTESQS